MYASLYVLMGNWCHLLASRFMLSVVDLWEGHNFNGCSDIYYDQHSWNHLGTLTLYIHSVNICMYYL